MLKHGHSRRHGRSPEYNAWKNMRQRCNNSNKVDYLRYGLRGIKVDQAWNDYETFFADMGPRPSPSHMLERKNNDLGYSKDNCIWAMPIEQTRNRGGQRANRLVTFQGKTMCIADAVEATGLPYTTILNRLNRGLSDEEACTTPRYRVRRFAYT